MSRRRAQGAAVRGPASALTSFLAGLGVEPSAPLTTWGNTSTLDGVNGSSEAGDETHLAPDGPVLMEGEGLDPAGAVTARTVEAGPSQVGEGTPEPTSSATKKRKGRAKAKEYDSDALDSDFVPSAKRSRATSVDSDDLEESSKASTPAKGKATPVGNKSGVQPGPKKKVGEFMNCGECGTRFTVTVYTKEHPTQPHTYICTKCCTVLGIDPFSKPKNNGAPFNAFGGKKKATEGRAARGKVVSYDERKGVTDLSDICIEIVGKYIEDVDQLGDIGAVNLEKICKIISKSRKLTPQTAPLFYSKDRTELAMYDCTLLENDSYQTLANLCPKLEKLNLQLCGQLQEESLIHWSKGMKHLKRLELFAPFLVRKDGWISLFKARGKQLEGLLVTQSPRIDLETVETLVKSCPNLTELRLAEVGMMCNDFLGPIGKLKKLTLLDLSSPPESLSDEAVVHVLSQVGKGIVELNLSDNSDLTDLILPAIAKHCPTIRRLYLRNLIELTDEGVADFFATLRKNGHPGLEVIDLEKGHELRGAALHALVQHSGDTVEKLSLLGWREVEKEAISELAKCSRLSEVNLGWCRSVTDMSIKELLDGCNFIKEIKVWGCNQLSDAVPRKKGVRVVGIETHSI